jgi:hypothetical protein
MQSPLTEWLVVHLFQHRQTSTASTRVYQVGGPSIWTSHGAMTKSRPTLSMLAIGMLIVVIFGVVILPSKERSVALKHRAGGFLFEDQLSLFGRPLDDTTTHHNLLSVINEPKRIIPEERETESFSACLLIMVRAISCVTSLTTDYLMCYKLGVALVFP